MDKLIIVSKKELKIINNEGLIVEHIISDDKDLIEFYKMLYRNNTDFKNLYEKEEIKK